VWARGGQPRGWTFEFSAIKVVGGWTAGVGLTGKRDRKTVKRLNLIHPRQKRREEKGGEVARENTFFSQRWSKRNNKRQDEEKKTHSRVNNWGAGGNDHIRGRGAARKTLLDPLM